MSDDNWLLVTLAIFLAPPLLGAGIATAFGADPVLALPIAFLWVPLLMLLVILSTPTDDDA